MKIFSNKLVQIISYIIFVILTLAVLVIVLHQSGGFKEFLNTIENRTFDLRQEVLANSHYKKINKDIVIITIDDASYEYLLSKYGEWPIPRGVYADMIKYLEAQNPKAIAFDLMFVRSIKSMATDDNALAEAINNNKSVYTSLNFDDQDFDVRTPEQLPNSMSVNVENNSKVDFSKELTFKNCRPILPQIMNGTKNIGLINVSRSNDGILRRMPPFVVYQSKFYPHLSLLVAMQAANDKTSTNRNFLIDKSSDLKIDNTILPMDKTGSVILNWYGPSGKLSNKSHSTRS